MGGRWKLFRFNLHKVLCAVLMIHLLSDECWSINLEGLALLEFRSRVESDPYGALENWDVRDGDPCNWNGVHCVDGKVVTLNLTEFSLQATLAPELGNLNHLKALVLNGNNFYGVIPEEIGRLTMLELLDLRCNMLNCPIPKKIREMSSLKHLLLCNNELQGNTPWIKNPNMHFDLVQGQNLSCDAADDLGHINRKVGHCFWEASWQKLKKIDSFLILLKGKTRQIFDISPLRVFLSSFRCETPPNGHQKRENNVATALGEPYIIPNIHVHALRHRLIEVARNLPAAPRVDDPVNQVVPASPIASGSFSATRDKPKLKLPSPPNPEPMPSKSTNSVADGPSSSDKSDAWGYLLILPVAALLITLVAFMFLVCRKKGVTTIGPWKTGLSGQLQKAFITGVPKLNGSELEAACEDFSNIIVSFPEFIIYKGTLSSGVEIAVVSTTLTSANDWSRHSEMLFRKKIDGLSHINHKNFVNLIGYCEEDQPFMRMMVLEYSPNGTLYEHLHLEEFECLDWSTRVRIIMGIAYCLQYIHELNPPIQHPDLLSNSIIITEDFSAKIGDFGVWEEFIANGKNYGDHEHSNTLFADPSSNVYSFGVLLLEIISGKIPQPKEQGPLLDLVSGYLNGGGVGSLVDSSLKCHKEEELRVICEVIQECMNPDARNRPSMKEVASKLREVTSISPEAATPRLSPLWWAELEILSVEAS
ncbi:protein MALE DISCOVERER 2 [Canna indica]|uniref:Protein MALE DISCOVERER 2 n=1 Tax=Canna indica TaxID=4628 RepID=A0AAQ3L520_9LILI|nr:protein MALE DISCOVERER 2 [Canna indica]